VSVKRKSTNLTSLSFTMLITSATVLAINNLLYGVGWLKNLRDARVMQFLCQNNALISSGRNRRLCLVQMAGKVERSRKTRLVSIYCTTLVH